MMRLYVSMFVVLYVLVEFVVMFVELMRCVREDRVLNRYFQL